MQSVLSWFGRNELRPGIAQQAPKGENGKEGLSVQSSEAWHSDIRIAGAQISIVKTSYNYFESTYLYYAMSTC